MSPPYRRTLITRAARLFDLAIVSLALTAAVGISSDYSTWPTLAEFLLLRVKIANILIFGFYLAVCSAIFSTCGFYMSHRLSRWTRQAREIFIATTFVTGLLYILPREMLFATTGFLITFWATTFLLLSLARVLGYQFFYYARSHGKNLRNIVLVGEGADAAALANRIEQEPALGYRILRIIDAKDAAPEKAQA